MSGYDDERDDDDFDEEDYRLHSDGFMLQVTPIAPDAHLDDMGD